MTIQAVILAAGKGTRMRSDRSKVMHSIAGRPQIEWVVQAAFEAGCERVVVVVGHQREVVQDHLTARFGDRVAFAVQEPQLGTGHAIHCALPQLRGAADRTLILSGDVPNIAADSLRDFVETTQDWRLAVMTAHLEDPARYGRIERDGDALTRIVEYADATEAQRELREINTGFYVVETGFLADALDEICSKPADNAQGEYYLTDIVELAAQQSAATVWTLTEIEQMQGVNTRADLAVATAYRRAKINQRWLLAGVTMIDPNAVYIDDTVQLAPDVVLHPGVQLLGETTIGAGTTVGNSTVIEDTTVGQNVDVLPFCHFESARIEDGARLGPMCHLRPGADIGPDCHVGNFVEVKKSRLDQGAKANHHSYIGDGHVGANANVGAGTIFCNYDGFEKHQTTIGANAFIGSNSALVAPVNIGEGAFVAAGSVVTTDIPNNALGVARGRQHNIEDWATNWRKQHS